MQIKELKKKGLEREFKILVPSKDVTEKLNVSLLEISKDVEIEGFRKCIKCFFIIIVINFRKKLR